MGIFLKTVIPVIAPHRLQLVILQFQCFLVNGILVFQDILTATTFLMTIFSRTCYDPWQPTVNSADLKKFEDFTRDFGQEG